MTTIGTARPFEIPSIKLPSNNKAEWMYERIVRSINDFEKDLKPQEEVGARLVSFGGKEIIHIQDVGYWGPDMIMFYGVNVDNQAVQLLQHISQVSILLVAVPAADPEAPNRIGFDLIQKLEKSDTEQSES